MIIFYNIPPLRQPNGTGSLTQYPATTSAQTTTITSPPPPGFTAERVRDLGATQVADRQTTNQDLARSWHAVSEAPRALVPTRMSDVVPTTLCATIAAAHRSVVSLKADSGRAGRRRVAGVGGDWVGTIRERDHLRTRAAIRRESRI